MRATEIEFKYNAGEISLAQFHAYCTEKGYLKYKEASGFDHFFSSASDLDGFFRHRKGADKNELTLKRKKADNNNFIRTEANLELHTKMSRKAVEDMVSAAGYIYNTSIFKNCFIYTYDWHTLVYYICYDAGMKELGRFIEIEMSETHDWTSEQEAWDALLVVEKMSKPLGLSPQCRIKRSLWEMYRKELG